LLVFASHSSQSLEKRSSIDLPRVFIMRIRVGLIVDLHEPTAARLGLGDGSVQRGDLFGSDLASLLV